MAVYRTRQRLAAVAAPLAVAGLAGAGCAVVWWADPTTPGGPLPVCPTYALFGVLCPGCGGLRMVYSLLHGDLAAAVHYNALALVALPVVAGAWVAWIAGRWRGSPLVSRPRQRWVVVSVLVVLSVWGVVRNLPFTGLSI